MQDARPFRCWVGDHPVSRLKQESRQGVGVFVGSGARRLPFELVSDADGKLTDIGGAGSPDWHIVVWDGQVRETDDGVRDYAGLGVLAAASGDTMDDALRAVRDILKRRTENA